VDVDVAAERLRRRREGEVTTSDADARVAAAMAQRMDDWPGAVDVRTDVEPAYIVRNILIEPLGYDAHP
jgi:hypothetical protein